MRERIRHYLIAALRNMAGNKLQSALTISGLALAFAAVILIALFVRDEFSYDKWIPGHDRSFAVRMWTSRGGAPATGWSTTTADLGDILQANLPGIGAVTRLRLDGGSLRHGLVEANETIYWADPNFFQVVPLPAIAGDLKTALARPDGIVITRRIARKYFGRDNAVGDILTLNRQHPMRVAAVLADLPSNTHLNTEIILSTKAAFSVLTVVSQAHRGTLDPLQNVRAVYTYIRLAPGASIDDLNRALPDFIARKTTATVNGQLRRIEPVLGPLDGVHLNQIGDSPMRPPGDSTTIAALAAIGALILVIAVINFINLMTAAAARRAVEIAVRKLSGAQRRDLAVQFIAEALLYVMAGLLLALALVEWLLPTFNALLQRSITFYRFEDGALLGALLAGTLATGFLAAIYPGFVLSAFRPVTVLRRNILSALPVGMVREALVVIQFAILAGLIIATAVVWRQSVYALREGARLNTDRVLLIQTACRSAFKQEVQNLSGVTGAACSALVPVKHESFSNIAHPGGGAPVPSAADQVDFGFFELYGLTPVAGRFFNSGHAADSAAHVGDKTQPSIVINQTAVRRFGFASPDAALGHTLSFQRFLADTGKLTPVLPARIIGVVPDFTTGSVGEATLPTIFYVDPDMYTLMSVRLKSAGVAQTLAAIDRLWEGIGPPRPIMRQFFQDQLQDVYAGITRTAQLLAALALAGIVIAGLGLFGLSAAATQRRIKEIGIRKAMGARRRDMLGMLLWQFAKPVLWANLIAWPLAFWIMKGWLNGFAYHIAMPLWLFPAVGAITLLIALLTVLAQALLVARQRPVLALRYE